jgi:hypothetical protein
LGVIHCPVYPRVGAVDRLRVAGLKGHACAVGDVVGAVDAAGCGGKIRRPG